LTEVWVYQIAPEDRAQIRAAATEKPQQEDRVSEISSKQIRNARILAVRRLAATRDQTAAATLAQILAQQDEDPLVRAQAALALAKVGGAEATAALSAAVGDQDPGVRIQAMRAFGKVEGERAVQTLSGVLMGDRDPQVRRHAAPALAMLRTLEARWALEAAISDPDQSVSEAAASALRRWEKRSAATSDGTY
jgi:HEAT repeat protein